MREGLVALGFLAGCYDQAAVVVPGAGDDDACEPAPPVLVEDVGPIAADAIPAWVEGQSDLVDEGGGVYHCIPHDPDSDEQYGCRTDDGRCVATPERIRVVDGAVVLSLGAVCAALMGDAPEFRIDGAPVAPNRVLWTIEIRLPVNAIEPGHLLDLWNIPCAAVTFRIQDRVALEADECGHEPFVNVQDDGYRYVECRSEWRPFRADVGVVPGLLAHSNFAISSASPAEGDRLTAEMNMGGCGATELAMVSGDGSPVPMNCCAGHAERGLEWTVGPGGTLLDGSSLFLGGYCCIGADVPFPDANCGEGDPGSW